MTTPDGFTVDAIKQARTMQSMAQFSHLVSGAAWNVLSKVLQFALGLIAIAVIARIIGPGAYGAYALGWVVLGLFELVISSAPNDILVQRRDLTAGHRNITFWTSLTIALVAWFAIARYAEPLSGWLNGGHLLALILPIRGAILPLRALAVVQTAQLIRDSRFKSLAALQSLCSIVGSSLAVIMALLGAGIWSLVAMELASAAVMLTGVCLLTRWRPGLAMRFRHMKELTAFNVSTWGSWGLGYFEDQLPRLLIGSAMGPQAVGYFSLAQRLFEQITQIIMIPTYQVVQAGTARAQDDPALVAQLARGTLRIVSVIAVPMFLGLSAIAPVLVPAVFGRDWIEAIVVVQILMLAGMRSSCSMVQIAVVRGMGKPQWELMSVALSVVLTASMLILALPYGLASASMAVIIAGFLVWPLEAWFVQRVTGLSIKAQGTAGAAATLAAIVMALTVSLLVSLYAADLGQSLILGLAVPGGAMVYWAMLRWLFPAASQVISAIVGACLRLDRAALKSSIGRLADGTV